MFRKSIAVFILVTLLSIPVIAGAAVSIPIDARENCFGTGAMAAGGIATFRLAPGRYVASIINNGMSCNTNTPSGNCLIDTVVIRRIGGESYGGSAIWGLAIKTPTVVDVLGTSSANFVAFIVDDPCGDNTGQATLRFQKAQ